MDSHALQFAANHGLEGVRGALHEAPKLSPPTSSFPTMDALLLQVARGSAAACYSIADWTARGDVPVQRPLSKWSRAAIFCVVGLVWETEAQNDCDHSPSWTESPEWSRGYENLVVADGRVGFSTRRSPSSLMVDLIRLLLSAIRHEDCREQNFCLDPVPTITSSSRRRLLHNTLESLGWRTSGPNVTITALASRLGKRLSNSRSNMATLPSLGSGTAPGSASHEVALSALLEELSRASSSSRRSLSSRPSPPSSDTSADERSAASSPPTSPDTKYRNELGCDNDNEVLNDSPPTTPSHTSSIDDLSKTYVPRPPIPYKPQPEGGRLAMRLDTSGRVYFPRRRDTSASSSGFSSVADSESSSPLSTTSVRSTASSMFSMLCGEPKTSATISVMSEAKPNMGVFIPLSIQTASGSLMDLGRRVRLRSRLGLPEGWQPSPAISIGSRLIPTVCVSHSSYQAPSPVSSESSLSDSPISSPENSPHLTIPEMPDVIPRRTLPTRRSTAPSVSRPTPPQPTRSNSVPAVPLAVSKLQGKPKAPQPSKEKEGAFPAMDPTLANLEKSCRLLNDVTCFGCGKAGSGFPKNRLGQALCSRECRIAVKAKECGIATSSMGAAKASVMMVV